MEDRSKLALTLEKLSVFITGVFVVFFPLVIATFTTEGFVLPKQFLLIGVSLLCLILLGIKGALIGSLRLRRTPFDLAILLFLVAMLLSSLFAVNRYDSLISFFPILFAGILFFVITNSAKRKQDFYFLSAGILLSSALVSIISVLSYFKLYVIPFEFAKNQAFSPMGSLFDQLIFILVALSFGLHLAWPALRSKKIDKSRLPFAVMSLVILAGTLVTAFAMWKLQKPSILPFEAGFQISFAAISQDTGRIIQGFLVGSGIGTFLTDFTRFKPASLNLNPTLWSLTFLRSSSFVLELLATTGLLGILSFGFLAFRIVRQRPMFVPLIALLVLSLIVPFSFPLLVLFFVLLGVYSVEQGLNDKNKASFFDLEVKFLALRRGVFALSDATSRKDSDNDSILAYGFLGLIALFSILFGFAAFRFLYSDMLFQSSLLAARQNNAQRTYELQTKAINTFPQRDGYHRIFSQINLTLANNLAGSTPKGSSPSAEVQQNIYRLIQQSINSGRNATTISPQSAINWQNLSGIYRSLIGFGENADQFSLLANQQALALDPSNPQEYVNLGGIFYQLGQWDNAIRQFQLAISLKPDFANAYYNLGHALEQKGDLKAALEAYQRVKSLVAQDKKSVEQINKDIAAIESKIGQAPKEEASAQPAQNQPELQVNQPATQLPAQNPQVKIPAPVTSATPQPSATPSPAPAP